MEKSIIVPYDFSEPAKNALDKAYKIANTIKKPIILIHIVNKKNEIQSKQAELDKVIEEYLKNNEKKEEVKIKGIVKKGSLFKTIFETAQENNAYFAVMGTHGKKTIKKAMKLVNKFEKIAFLLVQEPENDNVFTKFLVPLNTNKKSRANLNWVKNLNYYFPVKVYLLYPVFKSDMNNTMVKRNLNFAEKILEDNLIDYEVLRANIDKNYPDEIFAHAREYDVDTLTLMSNYYKSYIKKIKNQETINQYKKTPILCVNPRLDINKMGGLT